MTPIWIIGFSGHRHLQHPDQVRIGIHEALARMEQKIRAAGGRLHLFVGAACGADLLCIDVAAAMAIPVHIILPKPLIENTPGDISLSEGFAKDFFDAQGNLQEHEWNKALTFIRKAQSGADGWTCRLVNGSQSDPECYYDAGIQLIEAADMFLAVWDNQPARGLGGTAEMVEHAKKLQLPLMLCDPQNGNLTEFHCADFKPEDDQGQQLIKSLQLDPQASCLQQFQSLDDNANNHSQRFRNVLVKCIWLNAIATITAAVAALLIGTSLAAAQVVATLVLFEWVLVAIAWGKMRTLSRGHVHEDWVRSRFAVELMRSMFGSIRLTDPLHPPVSRHKKTWHRFAVTAGLSIQLEKNSSCSWQEDRDDYVRQRLDDLDTGQIPHFTKKQAAAAAIFDRLTKVQRVASASAVIFVFGAFLYKGLLAAYGMKTGGTIHAPAGLWSFLVVFFFKFIPIALPLIAGVAAALRRAQDSGRRKFRYQEMANRLQNSRQQLLGLKTESSCRRCVAVIEEFLLDELIEWELSERQNGDH